MMHHVSGRGCAYKGTHVNVQVLPLATMKTGSINSICEFAAVSPGSKEICGRICQGPLNTLHVRSSCARCSVKARLAVVEA